MLVTAGRCAPAASGLASPDHLHVGMRVGTRRLLDGVMLALTDPGSGLTTGGGPEEGGDNGHTPSSRGHGDVDPTRVEALVTLARSGDAEAFGQLYELYVGAVYRYVYSRTGNRQVAEDLTSETFLRALRGIDGFVWQGKDIGAWFVTIARNLVYDRTKSARYRLELVADDVGEGRPDADDGPETIALDRERDGRLLAAMRTLTPEQTECLVLRFMEGMSLAETAEILGKRENAVKQLQLRAVRALKRELDRG